MILLSRNIIYSIILIAISLILSYYLDDYTGIKNTLYGFFGSILFICSIILIYSSQFVRLKSDHSSFFGVRSNGRNYFKVFLSDAHYVNDGGERSISYSEYLGYKEIEQCIMRPHTKGLVPEAFEGLFDSIWRNSNTVTITPVILNQVSVEPQENTTIFILGGQSKNYMRRKYLQMPQTSFQLSREEELKVTDSSYVKIFFEGTKTYQKDYTGKYNLAVIEKRKIGTLTVFSCVGNRGDTTMLAAHYLCKKWKDLYKSFKNSDFAICLKFDLQADYYQELDLGLLKEIEVIGKEINLR